VAPRIAVLHHPRSFFPLDLFEQVGNAAELLWVVDGTGTASGGGPATGPATDGDVGRLLRRLGTVVDIGGLSIGDAAAELEALRPDGIVTFVDDLVETSAALAARLGLRYHSPEVARILVDKRLQRACLDRAGIPGPAFWPVDAGITPDEIVGLADRVAYPAVLKPAEGSGSRNIHHVESADVLCTLLKEHAGEGAFLLEEYLYDEPGEDGWYASYLSVESVVSNGRVGHVALTGRFPLAEPFRETGNFIPAILRPELVPVVLALVDECVRALGILDAVIHSEIKLTPDGPKVIEVNGRLGGRPPFVLRSVSDVNLFRAACHIAAGVPVELDALAECRGVGYWLMLQPPMSAQRVVSVEGAEEVATLDEVESVTINRASMRRVSWQDGTESRVVTVRGCAPDHDALAATVDSIRRRVSISYEG
jgi:hypothetical protein